MRNASRFLPEFLESIVSQTYASPSCSLEFSVFDDASEDNSVEIIRQFLPRFHQRGISVVISSLVHRETRESEIRARGVGFGKNRAVERASGEFLCFLDADDVMMPERVQAQLEAVCASPWGPEETLAGSQFVRVPEGSTARYTEWCNSLTESELMTRRFCECTVIMPTWFCHRRVFQRVGGFSEKGRGTPEDLIFFNRHLDLGGRLLKVERILLTYRYHQTSASHAVDRWTIWDERIEAIQKHVLDGATSFTIWNAGKEGRKFFRSLRPANRAKVVALCDVDEKKISLGVYDYFEGRELKHRIPVIHFSQARPLVIVCMKLDLTGGAFERNLASMNWLEGSDFFHFGL